MTKDKSILFPYIYHPIKSVGVINESFEFIDKNDYETLLSNLGWALKDVGDLIPQTTESFWSGNFFPWVEAEQEL